MEQETPDTTETDQVEEAPETVVEVAVSDEASTEETPEVAEASDGDAPELTLGSGAPADDAEVDPNYKPVIRGKIDKFGVAMGTGRRKTAVARVRIKKGDGQMTVNGMAIEDYFRIERDRSDIQAPLRITEMLGKVDVWVRVNGGGTTGQAGAIILGIARALQVIDESLHGKLAESGYLTRDGRMVERKKYGFKKARKSFQFSKR